MTEDKGPTEAEIQEWLDSDCEKSRRENIKRAEAAESRVKELEKELTEFKSLWQGTSGWEILARQSDKKIKELEAKLRIAKEALDWVRQTVHRAHHDEESLNDCRKNTCIGAKQALSKIKESK